MKLVLALATAAAALALSACADDYYYDNHGYGYGGSPYYYDGYYDGFYGPTYSGYWGGDGFFYYSRGRDHVFIRDEGRHFRRDVSPGFNRFRMQGPQHPEHLNGGGNWRGDQRGGDGSWRFNRGH